MDCSTPGSSDLHCLLEFAQIHVHWVGDTIYLSHPLATLSLFALSLSQGTWVVLPVESSYQLGKLLEVQLQHWSFYWIFRVDFFRIDWFSLLDVQGTLKNLLQQHNLKASVLWCSAFFVVQLKHWYTTTVKTIALTIWTSVGKMMTLLFNMISMFVTAFLPRRVSLILWL